MSLGKETKIFWTVVFLIFWGMFVALAFQKEISLTLLVVMSWALFIVVLFIHSKEKIFKTKKGKCICLIGIITLTLITTFEYIGYSDVFFAGMLVAIFITGLRGE